MKQEGWFITSASLVLCLNRLGHQVLLPRTKRGIPAGALDHGNRRDAEVELDLMRRTERWPLFSHEAQVEHIKW
jgi:hypothetical protein